MIRAASTVSDLQRYVPIRLLIALCAITASASQVSAQLLPASLPEMFTMDTKGKLNATNASDLCTFELRLRELFALKSAPDEVIALAFARPAHLGLPTLGLHVGMNLVLVYGKEGELRAYRDDELNRYYFRRIPATEMDHIRMFLASNHFDKLPERTSERRRDPDGSVTMVVGGSQYLYLRINPRKGVRIPINNPPGADELIIPPDDPAWRYTKLVDFLYGLHDPKKPLEVRYELPRPIEGLEVLLAPTRTEVTAVWKQGEDVCVTTNAGNRERDPVDKHHVLRDGKLGAEVPDFHRSVQRAAKVNGTTLYPACVSIDRRIVAADGRWVLGNHRDTEDLMCFDRQKHEFVPIKDEDTRLKSYPLYYLEAHQRFLLGRFDPKDTLRSEGARRHRSSSEMRLLDPTTGEVEELDALPDVDTSFLVDLSLWFQQLPRRLQPVRGHEHLVWAAVPEGNSTCVGKYDTKLLQWVHCENIPSLKFETKDIWVDEDESKIYVVYKGHLLRIKSPLREMPVDAAAPD